MNIVAVKTPIVRKQSTTLFDIITKSIATLPEFSILAVTSKIVSLCEGSVVSASSIDKDDLIKQEADYYIDLNENQQHFRFTIKNNTLIPTSGIDESNGGGDFILWPKNTQATADTIREQLCKHYGIANLGIIITDSTCTPMRRGTTGICMAHSGFLALKNYVGQEDLFDKPFRVSAANISGPLAASAVLMMGEGTEQTPLAIITDVPFVEFQDRNPTKEELATLTIEKGEDLFAPFFTAVTWHKGGKASAE